MKSGITLHLKKVITNDWNVKYDIESYDLVCIPLNNQSIISNDIQVRTFTYADSSIYHYNTFSLTCYYMNECKAHFSHQKKPRLLSYFK